MIHVSDCRRATDAVSSQALGSTPDSGQRLKLGAVFAVNVCCHTVRYWGARLQILGFALQQKLSGATPGSAGCLSPPLVTLPFTLWDRWCQMRVSQYQTKSCLPGDNVNDSIALSSGCDEKMLKPRHLQGQTYVVPRGFLSSTLHMTF